MGTVYRVEHLGIGREMALKVLHSEMGTSPALRERFLREARSTAKLEHPGIVQVTDFGSTQGEAPFMVMELIRGRGLSQLSAAEVTFERAISLMQQILRALEHAHARKVVHRDLKPDNIMLVERDEEGPEDEVKILDFGLAMLLQQGSPRITQAGAIFGTPRYMSPEQASGEIVDHRTDLYSVAVMLTEVLTGRALFDGETAAQVLSKQITQTPEFRIPAHEGWDHNALQAVLRKGLSKNPKTRFDDARTFRKAISACRLSEVPEAEVSIADISAIKPVGGRLKLGLGMAALAGLLIAGFLMTGPDFNSLEDALATNELDRATEIAHKLLAKHPKNARLHLYQGHIDFARDDVKDALASYGKALELDSAVAEDAHFIRNVRTMVEHEDPTLESLMRHLTRHGGVESAPLFAHIAQASHKWPLRRTAYEALERMDDFGGIDQMAYLSAQLGDNSTRVCAIRRWYVERLIALDDPRTVPALAKEHSQRKCAKKLIAKTLSKFGQSDGTP